MQQKTLQTKTAEFTKNESKNLQSTKHKKNAATSENCCNHRNEKQNIKFWAPLQKLEEMRIEKACAL